MSCFSRAQLWRVPRARQVRCGGVCLALILTLACMISFAPQARAEYLTVTGVSAPNMVNGEVGHNGSGAAIRFEIKFNELLDSDTLAEDDIVNISNADIRSVWFVDFGEPSERLHIEVAPLNSAAPFTIMLPQAAVSAGGKILEENFYLTVAHDNTSPTPTIEVPGYATESRIPVRVIFDEPVSGFTANSVADQTHDGLVLADTETDFRKVDDSTYLLFMTVENPEIDGSHKVVIDSGRARDKAGNDNTAVTSAVITYVAEPEEGNEAARLVSMSNSNTANGVTSHNGAPVTLDFVFSRDIEDFTLDDITEGLQFRGNTATASGFSGSGSTYSVTLHPVGAGDILFGFATTWVDPSLDRNYFLTIPYDNTNPVLTLEGVPETASLADFEVTFNFSEPVSNFDLFDINSGLSGATATDFVNVNGASSTYTARIEPDGTGDIDLSIANGAATDAAGNASTSAVAQTISYVAAGTGLSLEVSHEFTMHGETRHAGQRLTYTFQFSDWLDRRDYQGNELSMGDVEVTNGTVVSVRRVRVGVYAADILPDGPADMTIFLAKNRVLSRGRQILAEDFSLTVPYDDTPPEVTWSSGISASSSPVKIPYQFNEPVVGFTKDVVNAVIENVSDNAEVVSDEDFKQLDNNLYEVLITLDDPGSNTAVGYGIGADRVTDTAGNYFVARDDSFQYLPTTHNNAKLDVATPNMINGVIRHRGVGQDFVLTLTFDRDVTGFASNDVQAVNGAAALTADSLQAVGGSLQVYELTLQPTGVGDGSVSFWIDAGGVNPNIERDHSYVFNQDTTPPVLSLDALPETVVGLPFEMTFSFSEPVSGFEFNDISVSGATVDEADFAQVDDQIYTLTMTPDGTATVQIDVAANAALDVAGHGNSAVSNSATFAEVPGTARLLSVTGQYAIDGVTRHDGLSRTYTFEFSEALDPGSFTESDIVGVSNMRPAFNLRVSEVDGEVNRVFTVVMGSIVSDQSFTFHLPQYAVSADGIGLASDYSQTVEYDAEDPTVALEAPTFTDKSPFKIVYRFSEPVSGLDAGVLQYVLDERGYDPATLTDFIKVDSSTYIAYASPNDEANPALLNVGVIEGEVRDASGRHQAVRNFQEVNYDPTANTVVLDITGDYSISDVNRHNGNAFNLTFKFDEAVSNFDASSITAVSGLTAHPTVTPTGDPSEYTVFFSPQDTVTDITFEVEHDAVSPDLDRKYQVTIVADTTAPTITLEDMPDSVSDEPFTMTIKFSEAVTGFTVGDVSRHLSGATADNFRSSDPSTYSVIITPDRSGDVTIDIAEDAAVDLAGNGSAAVSQTVNYVVGQGTISLNVYNDNTIDGQTGHAGAGNTVTLKFEFSETLDAGSFTLDDIESLGNANPTDLRTSDDRVFEVDISANFDEDFRFRIGKDSVSAADKSLASNFDYTVYYHDSGPDIVFDAPAKTASDPFTVGIKFVDPDTGAARPVSDFDASDLAGAITNGSLLNGASDFRKIDDANYEVTITPAAEAVTVVTSIAANVAEDISGQLNSSATTETAFDIGANVSGLTVTGLHTVDGSTGHRGQEFTLTFTFDQAIAAFEAADITKRTGATIGDPSGSGAVYEVVFTPTGTQDISFSIAKDALSVELDRDYNVTIPFDGNIPILSMDGLPITIDDQPFTATFEFTEPVSGFNLAAINAALSGGTADTFTNVDGGSKTYSANITPDAINDVEFDFAKDLFMDRAGNGNKFLYKVAAYAGPPPLTVSGLTTDNTVNGVNRHNGEDFTATVTFSEAITDLDYLDITGVTGFAALNAGDVTSTDGGISWQIAVDPTGTATISFTIAAGAVESIADSKGLSADFTPFIAYDGTPPGLTLTGVPEENNSTPFTVTFEFDEDVGGFVETDINLTHAESSEFTTDIPFRKFTALITPSYGDVEVKVTADAVHDSAGNGNTEVFDTADDTRLPTATNISPAIGRVSGGTEVTISGTHFADGETSVEFGDGLDLIVEAGSVTVSEAGDKLTLDTPDASAVGAARVPIQVTTPVGTSTDLVYFEFDDSVPQIQNVTAPSANNGSNFDVDIVFSEPVKDFDETDLTTSSGVTSVTVTPTSAAVNTDYYTDYRLTVDPDGAGDIVLSLDADAVENQIGLKNVLDEFADVTLDTERPTSSFPVGTYPDPVIDVAAYAAGSFEVTLEMSEPIRVADFDEDNDINFSSNVSNFSFVAQGPTAELKDKFVFTIQLEDNGEDFVMEFLDNVVADAAGNGNVGASLTIPVDITPPELTVQAPTHTDGETPFNVIFSFSEDVTNNEIDRAYDFTQSDITGLPAAAVITSFTADPRDPNRRFIVVIDPDGLTGTGITENVDIDVAVTDVRDAFGHELVAAADISVVYSTTAPAIYAVTPSRGGPNANTDVIISGVNLSGVVADGVTFGGEPATTFDDTDPFALEATTPVSTNGTYVAEVKVETAGGIATAPEGFVYADSRGPDAHDGTFTTDVDPSGPLAIEFSGLDHDLGDYVTDFLLGVVHQNEIALHGKLYRDAGKLDEVDLGVGGNKTFAADVNNKGMVYFQPNSGYIGTFEFEYKARDISKGGGTAGTITVNVVPANTAPTANNDNYTAVADVDLEVDTGLPVDQIGGVLKNDSDDEHNIAVTEYQLSGGSPVTAGNPLDITGYGDLTINANGSFSFAVDPSATGTVPTVTYTIIDDHPSGPKTATANLNIVINAANTPPRALADSKTMSQRVDLEVDADAGVLANDQDDDDGQILSVQTFWFDGDGSETTAGSGKDDPENKGTLTINPDGSYTFARIGTPALGALTKVYYKMTDNAGGTDTTILNLTIADINTPPHDIPESITNTTTEDLTLTVNNGAAEALLTGLEDDEGDPFGVTFVQMDENGNGVQNSARAVVDGTPVTVPLTADNGAVSIGDITFGYDGSYELIPTADFEGALPDITYTVGDVRGASDTGILKITVDGVNDAPTDISITPAYVDAHTAHIGEDVATDVQSQPIDTLVGVDVDDSGTELTYTIVDGELDHDKFVIAGTNNDELHIAVGTALDYETMVGDKFYKVKVTVTDDGDDGNGLNAQSKTVELQIDIDDVNEAPTTEAIALPNDDEDPALGYVEFELLGEDQDDAANAGGQIANFKITDLSNLNGSLYPAFPVVEADELTDTGEDNRLVAATYDNTEQKFKASVYYVPTPHFSGAASFTYSAVDNGNPVALEGTSSAALITLDEVQDIPVADGEEIANIDEDAASVTVTLSGYDPDPGGSITSFEITDTSNLNGTLHTGTPPVDENLLTVTTITSITAPNPPAIEYTATLYYKPTANFVGDATFTYKSVDDDSPSAQESADATITLKVESNQNNDAPVAATYTASGGAEYNEDVEYIAVELKGQELDPGDTITQFKIKELTNLNGKLYLDADPLGRELTINGTYETVDAVVDESVSDGFKATVYYEPAADFEGSAKFKYSAIDDEPGTPAEGAAAEITIEMNPVDDPPIANNVDVNGAEDATSVEVILSGTDPDTSGSVDEFKMTNIATLNGALYPDNSLTPGEELAVGDELSATLDGPSGEYRATIYYVPDENFSGDAIFTYLAHDDTERDSEEDGTVTITVDAVNDAPEITNPADGATIQVEDGETTVTTVEARDEEEDELTFSVVAADDGDKFTVDPNTGELTFINPPDVDDPKDVGGVAPGDNIYVVTVQVTDDGEPTESSSINLNVKVISGDETPPTVVITAPEEVRGAFDAVVTFSEPVFDFEQDELTVDNAQITEFTGDNGDTVYTFTLEPQVMGDVALSVAAGVTEDGGGNLNEASELLVLDFVDEEEVKRKTKLVIGKLLTHRGRITTQFRPNFTRRLQRLGGNYQNNSSVSAFGMTYQDGRLPATMKFEENKISFAYSMRNALAASGEPELSGKLELQRFGLNPTNSAPKDPDESAPPKLMYTFGQSSEQQEE
ncbi:MAG: Ig-like domain-containing protein, partial [Rhizobiaceae bacterium]